MATPGPLTLTGLPDYQRAIFGPQGAFEQVGARGMSLYDTGGNITPEAAYYANQAAANLAGQREEQLAQRDLEQQRVNIAGRQASAAERRARTGDIAALGMGTASLLYPMIGTARNPGPLWTLSQYLYNQFSSPGGAASTGPNTIGRMFDAMSGYGQPAQPMSDMYQSLLSAGWTPNDISAAMQTGFLPAEVLPGAMQAADAASYLMGPSGASEIPDLYAWLAGL